MSTPCILNNGHSKNWLGAKIKACIENSVSTTFVPYNIGIIINNSYSSWPPSLSAMALNQLGAEAQNLWIWSFWSKKLQFHFLGSFLDTLRYQMVFFIKTFVHCWTYIFVQQILEKLFWVVWPPFRLSSETNDTSFESPH